MQNKRLIVTMIAVLAGAARPALAAKPVSCGSDVGVNVTIAGSTTNDQATPDAQLGSSVYRLVSDGAGVYSNGARVKGGTLSAFFQVDNCTYDFTLNLSNLSRKSYVRNAANGWTPVWFFNFDRVASVPITASSAVTGQLTDPAAAVFCSDGGVIYDPQNPGKPLKDANGVHDNYGGCQTDADGNWYVLRAAGMSLDEGSGGSSDPRMRFNVSPLDTAVIPVSCPSGDARCATSLMRVYHPNATTWTIVPHDVPMVQPSPAPNPPLWVGLHQSCAMSCSPDYFLSTPFKITLVRQ